MRRSCGAKPLPVGLNLKLGTLPSFSRNRFFRTLQHKASSNNSRCHSAFLFDQAGSRLSLLDSPDISHYSPVSTHHFIGSRIGRRSSSFGKVQSLISAYNTSGRNPSSDLNLLPTNTLCPTLYTKPRARDVILSEIYLHRCDLIRPFIPQISQAVGPHMLASQKAAGQRRRRATKAS